MDGESESNMFKFIFFSSDFSVPNKASVFFFLFLVLYWFPTSFFQDINLVWRQIKFLNPEH